MYISQPFEELKLYTPKPITWTYFDTILSRFGLAGLPIAAILDFQMSIFQPFQELQGLKLEFKLITHKPINRTCVDTNLIGFGLAGLPIAAILNF